MGRKWCRVCCTDHSHGSDCPGELAASGEERHGWRVNVETPRGIEAYGVLVAESYGLWRARILTYPNILWMSPGGGGTIKFVGNTPQSAEQKAADFIRNHCHDRGYVLRTGLAEVTPDAIDEEVAPAVLDRPVLPPARRKVRFLPVRFGVTRASESGKTGDLSETGLFVITPSPVESGRWVHLMLETDEEPVQLRGMVRWSRDRPHEGRSPGMGIQLQAPPPNYMQYVRKLA